MKINRLFRRLDTKGFGHGALLLFILVGVSIAGIYYMIATHAAVANCNNYSSGNNTVTVCANIDANNYVTAQAKYTGVSNKDLLTTGSVTLYTCPTTIPSCTSVTGSNSQIYHDNIFVPRKATLVTGPSIYSQKYVYKACVTLTNKSGWNLPPSCTPVVTFGVGYGDIIKIYTPPTTSTPPPTTTNNPSTPPSAGSNTPTDSTKSPAPSCGGVSVGTKADGTPWTCSFSDEFSGDSLNRTLWNVQTTATSGFATTNYGSNPRACFMDTPKNVSVSGGYLNLTVAQESASFACNGARPVFNTTYTAAEVQSLNKFSQQYGRFEVRAKLPDSAVKGLQETFWLWPNNMTKYGAWPGSGEFDFAEFYSKYNNLNVPISHYNVDPKTVDFAKHLNTYTPVIYYDSNFNNCYFPTGAFNTYTAVWRSGYMEVDVNGKPCLVDNYTSTTGANPAPFDQPFFLALTQAIGVNAGADNEFVPGSTPLPATTQVDYVRVWK